MTRTVYRGGNSLSAYNVVMSCMVVEWSISVDGSVYAGVTITVELHCTNFYVTYQHTQCACQNQQLKCSMGLMSNRLAVV